MDQTENIRELLLAAQKKAVEQVARVYDQIPLSKAFLRDAVRRYVFSRYLLDEDDYAGSDLNEITEYSLAKSMKISKELVKEFDIARSCAGSSSAIAKKVLLFMAIQRDFDVYLPTESTGRIKTIDDLSDLIWNGIMLKPVFVYPQAG